jgi:hypothetical protein
MDNELANKIRILKSKARIKEEEINIAKTELSSIKKELFELEWPLIKWSALEKYLKDNPKDRYEDNPEVKSCQGHHFSYCRIITEGEDAGEMQIGPYYHHDSFPRGGDIRVSYNFEKYR